MIAINGCTLMLTGLATLAFIGYCIYFDYKRRKDPEYKRRIHERRLITNQKKLSAKEARISPLSEEVVEYFLQHVYKGEVYARRNDWNRAVHNFANAIMICADPNILLCKLQKVIPIELYDQIMARVRKLIHTSDNWSISSDSSSMSDSYESNLESTMDSQFNTEDTAGE